MMSLLVYMYSCIIKGSNFYDTDRERMLVDFVHVPYYRKLMLHEINANFKNSRNLSCVNFKYLN